MPAPLTSTLAESLYESLSTQLEKYNSIPIERSSAIREGYESWRMLVMQKPQKMTLYLTSVAIGGNPLSPAYIFCAIRREERV